MNRDREHDRSLDDLLRRPHLLGIENVLYACREVKFYRPHSKDIYCEPDLIFFNGRYFAVEYKATRAHRHEAIHQLHRAKEAIIKEWGAFPELLFAYSIRKGRYGVEHI